MTRRDTDGQAYRRAYRCIKRGHKGLRDVHAHESHAEREDQETDRTRKRAARDIAGRALYRILCRGGTGRRYRRAYIDGGEDPADVLCAVTSTLVESLDAVNDASVRLRTRSIQSSRKRRRS